MLEVVSIESLECVSHREIEEAGFDYCKILAHLSACLYAHIEGTQAPKNTLLRAANLGNVGGKGK